MKRYTTVDEYLSDHEEWSDALNKLRNIMLNSGLEETVKWAAPTYTWKGKNIVGLAAFKKYVGIWFFQGGLLQDKAQMLINAQEGKTKAMRQWHFNSHHEIDEQLVGSYVQEAILNQQMGKKIKPDRNKPLNIPEELHGALSKDPNLAACFEEFTLSKKREFTTYIEEAKREETKIKRLEKIIPMILEKKGLHDKYRDC